MIFFEKNVGEGEEGEERGEGRGKGKEERRRGRGEEGEVEKVAGLRVWGRGEALKSSFRSHLAEEFGASSFGASFQKPVVSGYGQH